MRLCEGFDPMTVEKNKIRYLKYYVKEKEEES